MSGFYSNNKIATNITYNTTNITTTNNNDYSFFILRLFLCCRLLLLLVLLRFLLPLLLLRLLPLLLLPLMLILNPPLPLILQFHNMYYFIFISCFTTQSHQLHFETMNSFSRLLYCYCFAHRVDDIGVPFAEMTKDNVNKLVAYIGNTTDG